MPKTYISLTSIPPRFPLLEPTLQSLVRQSAKIEGVILWIPETYRRFDLQEADLSRLPDWVEIRRCPTDLGPATKVLPAIQAFKGCDVRILYCDDDRTYDHDWAANFLAESDANPDACIVEAGECVAQTLHRATAQTTAHKILKRLTLGAYGRRDRKKMRRRASTKGPVDIAKGFGGVLVKPDFFEAWAVDIPKELIAVDDIWLSGCMAVAGVRVLRLGVKRHSQKTEAAALDALIDLVSEDLDRNGANVACIRYFQKTYGIWGGQLSTR